MTVTLPRWAGRAAFAGAHPARPLSLSRESVVFSCYLSASLGYQVVDEAHVITAGFLEAALDALEGSTTTRVPSNQGIVGCAVVAHDHHGSGAGVWRYRRVA